MTPQAHRLVLVIVLAVGALACSLNTRPALAPERMAELWVPPDDLERRDLVHGPGGSRNAPDPAARFDFVSVKKAGTQPGYDVRDPRGREWSVKQGVESRTEVVVSRLLWAVGYHQPDNYYVPRWTLTRDGVSTVQPAGRFRLEAPKKAGEWSWRDNPFLGTRQMAGLFVLMVMVNNWDLKTAQNALYEVPGPGAPAARYVVRDLGASFGRTRWLVLPGKDDPEDFEREPFIRGVAGNRVLFHFDGAWSEPQLHGSVTPEDVRWTCQLLSRLTPRQWMDAFRAGGYDEVEAARYIERLQAKVAEGLTVE